MIYIIRPKPGPVAIPVAVPGPVAIPVAGPVAIHYKTQTGTSLIMYIISTLEFPTHNLKFHLLTTSVNAKYYY